MSEDAAKAAEPAGETPSGVTRAASQSVLSEAETSLPSGSLANELAGLRGEVRRLTLTLQGSSPGLSQESWNELHTLQDELHVNVAVLLNQPDGAAQAERRLRETLSHRVSDPATRAARLWELVGVYYLHSRRPYPALSLFFGLYDCMLEAQAQSGSRCHKGMPLCWISDCYWQMEFPALAKRFLMLTLCEDALSNSGEVRTEESGVYFRMAWRHGMPDSRLREYFRRCYSRYLETKSTSLFPEEIVQGLDHGWMTELPAPSEAGIYSANLHYLHHLLSQLGSGTGTALEILAEYLLSCMPGCRTARHVQTPSTDLDVVCCVDGFEVDFRSELGRYFVCECKDWKQPADFTAFAKFSRVLDSVKARFGILFSREGLSGAGKTQDAERDQLKVFQDRGMVIVVVDNSDLKQLASGANFTSMLRDKYERVRLDLMPARTSRTSRQNAIPSALPDEAGGDMSTIATLGPSSKRKRFTYVGSVKGGAEIQFEKSQAHVSSAFFRALLDHFGGKTIPGGFSFENPTPGGLGEWVCQHSPELNSHPLTPRHASHIAAILVHEGYAQSSLRGAAVWLHFAKEGV